ncbi:MAG: DUF2867 domain-containing protein [Pseudonocardia sp.]
MVANIHQRVVDAPIEVVGPLLDRIGGPDDPLWPSPAWAPMRLDGPLAVGVAGGHGGIRYRVHEHVPGRRVGFTFEPGSGMQGTHAFVAEPLGPRRTLLTHEANGRLRGIMRLGWPLGVRWVHDAVVEELLDRAGLTAGAPPERPARWTPYVRLLQRLEWPWAREVPPRSTPLLAAEPPGLPGLPQSPEGSAPPEPSEPAGLPAVSWADAYAIERRPGTPDDARTWTDAALGRPLAWVVPLLAWRWVAARLCGLGSGADVRIIASAPDEVLLGSDGAGDTTRISIRVEPRRVVFTTVVALTSVRGRAFSALVRHVHPWAVRGMLRGAAGRLSRATPPVGSAGAVRIPA